MKISNQSETAGNPYLGCDLASLKRLLAYLEEFSPLLTDDPKLYKESLEELEKLKAAIATASPAKEEEDG